MISQSGECQEPPPKQVSYGIGGNLYRTDPPSHVASLERHLPRFPRFRAKAPHAPVVLL